MSEEINSTITGAPAKPPDNWFVDGLKKNAVTLAFAVVFAFYTFIYNSHDSQKDLAYQVATHTKAIEKLVAADKEQSDAMSNILIALTKVSEAQNRLATDIRDITEQQRRNTELLFNRK
jgi:hypothetical protein